MAKLEIKNLSKNYKEVQAVKDLSLNIESGKIYGFIGPNGAGKSSTIRCIFNLINYQSGKILFDGEEIKKDSIDIKTKIGYLPSEINLYDDLTVQEMIDYNAKFYKKEHQSKTKYLVEILELDCQRKISELSLGNQKKLGIVLAMMHDPTLLILDEPTSGLDPLMQKVFYDLLLEEKRKGVTILFSTHVLSEIKRICDEVYIIKSGTIIKAENVNTLETDHYLTITINSQNIEKIKEKIEYDKIIKEDHNTIQFLYSKDINLLISQLNKEKISRLLIEEPNLEDIFINYYE